MGIEGENLTGESMPRVSTPGRVGVRSSGDVGQVLANGLQAQGYEDRIGTRTPGKLAKFSKSTGIAEGTFRDVAAWAEAVVLAVLGTAALDAIELAGPNNLSG